MRRLFVILILLSVAFAEIPATLSYQGKITDTDGIGLNGTYPVTFKIYDVETGGTELWSESHGSILVNKGLFSVILGNITPLELPFDEQYWLEIIIDGDDMSPRQPINAVAYAFRAGIADSLAGGIPEATGDTMIAHWDSIRNVPDDIMQEGEDISLLSNDANYIDTVNTDSTLSGNGAISPLSLAQRGATEGQVLKWHDSSWRPMDESSSSSNAILNQTDSVQTADFKISGDGELSSIRLKPNSSGAFPETAAGTFATIGEGETFKVFVNDGEYWHELSYNQACNTFGCGICEDYDGNIYSTVQIGGQCWMAENLKTTHYKDGTPISHVTNSMSWAGLDISSTGAYCYFINDTTYINDYGFMYNWYAVDDACGLCPDGWRVPSDNDYKTLEIYLGMDPTEADGEGWRGTDQGSQLADGYDLWTNGTLRNNSQFGTSDFMALPAGLRDEDGFYVDMSSIIFFWTSSEQSSVQAWQRALYYANSGLGRDNYSKIFGLSVRCIRE